MVFDVSTAMTWILFLALFPIAFYWLRGAYRILVKRDFSDVALKRGESPANPAKWAPYEMAINLVGGTIVTLLVVAIVLGEVDYETWSAVAGSTIWCKFFASFGLSRQAHVQLGRPPRSAASVSPAPSAANADHQG